ncbi:conserved hypothetical protein [Ricinus communis]|uniref:Uncharacterized protein n=1 Tax=Ricinus communis TaxID=3988 RepID=B9T9S3_RICCO|nr:conserved hypothetical protein [Ricinus communis]
MAPRLGHHSGARLRSRHRHRRGDGRRAGRRHARVVRRQLPRQPVGALGRRSARHPDRPGPPGRSVLRQSPRHGAAARPSLFGRWRAAPARSRAGRVRRLSEPAMDRVHCPPGRDQRLPRPRRAYRHARCRLPDRRSCDARHRRPDRRRRRFRGGRAARADRGRFCVPRRRAGPGAGLPQAQRPRRHGAVLPRPGGRLFGRGRGRAALTSLRRLEPPPDRVRRIGQQLHGQRRREQHEQRPHTAPAIADRQPRADLVAGHVRQRHRDAEPPEQLAARDHREQPGEIGREVEELGVADRADQPQPRQRNQHGGEERARARPEEPVIEADAGDDQREPHRPDPGVAIGLAHPRRQQEIKPHQDQQHGHEGPSSPPPPRRQRRRRRARRSGGSRHGRPGHR